MSAWSELEKAALLGTRRESAPRLSVAPELDAALARLRSEDAGHDLLRAAGVLDLYEQIGRSPARLQAELAAALPPEARPPCPPRAAQFLAQMLDGPRRVLMEEFLRTFDAAGWRIPETLLPNILAFGYARATVRPLILPLIGRRGRWLAAQHDNWHYAAVDPYNWRSVRLAWEQASVAKRPSLVAQLRAAAPEQGRALIESTWRSENDQQRFRLIKQLAEGLSMADEPLLESALDDRSRLVRKQAAELLACLPGSRLARRMAGYVPLYLAWTPRARTGITISLPEVTPAMRRDGIIGSASNSAAIVRGQEMIQLVSAVPLESWRELWGCTPRELLGAIPGSKWPRTLTTGLVNATLRQQDPAWAQAIIAALGVTPLTAKVVPVLPADELARLTAEALGDRAGPTLPNDSPLLAIMRLWTGAWPTASARSLLAALAEHMRATADQARPNTAVRDRLLRLSRQAAPELIDDAVAELGERGDLGCWQATTAEFLQTLRFRREMLAVLEPQ